jgi:hypothetical protein
MSFAKSSQRSERSRHTRLPARQEAGKIDLYFVLESHLNPPSAGRFVRFAKTLSLRMTMDLIALNKRYFSGLSIE